MNTKGTYNQCSGPKPILGRACQWCSSGPPLVQVLVCSRGENLSARQVAAAKPVKFANDLMNVGLICGVTQKQIILLPRTGHHCLHEWLLTISSNGPHMPRIGHESLRWRKIMERLASQFTKGGSNRSGRDRRYPLLQPGGLTAASQCAAFFSLVWPTL